jgi:DNA polymerase III delta prime subunit
MFLQLIKSDEVGVKVGVEEEEDEGEKRKRNGNHLINTEPSRKKSNDSIPWVEKYRPDQFNDIVLDPLNKQIMRNAIETDYFPNLLFHGPPGTGKTTTIINLVNAYQTKMKQPYKQLVIHLNASDERGIDIIRNQINQFVSSKTMFNQGMKFVILDEVDYMTKNAQQALKYLLQTYNENVRFCLICNYISKIDDGLQNEFLKLRFKQLPKEHVIAFLTKISVAENLNLSVETIELIQTLYNSDIRSMINCMQTNQYASGDKNSIISDAVWKQWYAQFLKPTVTIDKLSKSLHSISCQYSIDKKNIIKDFLNYIVRNKPQMINHDFLFFVENLMHHQECANRHYVNYSLVRIKAFVHAETSGVES